MYLTRAQNPSEVQRYSHFRPARILGPQRCDARSPDGHYACTRPSAHEPPHVAHTLFRQVVAVWDQPLQDPGSLSKSLDQTMVLDYKAEALASPIVKESTACATLLASRLGTSTAATLDHERRLQLARDFAFIFCLLTDQIAAERLPPSLRDLFVARLALLVTRQLAVDSTSGQDAPALVLRLSRWRAAHRAADNPELVRLWATDLPTRYSALPPQLLTTLAADLASLEWKSLETDVSLDLRLLDSLLHPKETAQPASTTQQHLPPCPRCSQPRTGMLLCSQCEQLAWRIAEGVSNAINLTANSVSGLSEAAPGETVDRLRHIHREVVLLYYAIILHLQDLGDLVPEMHDVFSGWLRAVIITNVLLPIEPFGDDAPKVAKDAAMNRLGALIDERVREYDKAGQDTFAECARLTCAHFGIDANDPQSLDNIALMFSRAWSGIADHVIHAIRALRR